LQIFGGAALNAAQAKHFSDCPRAEGVTQKTKNFCPEHYDYYHSMCYKVSGNRLPFVEAEMECMPPTDATGRYASRLMWTEKRHVLAFVQRLVKDRMNWDDFWIGLDDRSDTALGPTGLWETRYATNLCFLCMVYM
jgi:hypothetical protein